MVTFLASLTQKSECHAPVEISEERLEDREPRRRLRTSCTASFFGKFLGTRVSSAPWLHHRSVTYWRTIVTARCRCRWTRTVGFHSSQIFGLPLIPLVRPSSVFVLLVRPRPSDPAWLDFLVDGPDLPEVLYSAYKVPSSLASLLVMRKFSQHSFSLLRTRT